MVSAADPSASPWPAASDDAGTAPSDDGPAAPQRGARGGDHLCPEDQGNGGGGGSTDDGDGGSEATPAPTTVPDSDV
jgi:hypothetical protein